MDGPIEDIDMTTQHKRDITLQLVKNYLQQFAITDKNFATDWMCFEGSFMTWLACKDLSRFFRMDKELVKKHLTKLGHQVSNDIIFNMTIKF